MVRTTLLSMALVLLAPAALASPPSVSMVQLRTQQAVAQQVAQRGARQTEQALQRRLDIERQGERAASQDARAADPRGSR